MSGPHVAGAAALILAAKPDLAPAEVAEILIGTADDMLTAGHDEISGYGMIDVAEAVDAAFLRSVDLSGDTGGGWRRARTRGDLRARQRQQRQRMRSPGP